MVHLCCASVPALQLAQLEYVLSNRIKLLNSSNSRVLDEEIVLILSLRFQGRILLI